MFRGLTKIGQSYLAKKISKQEPVEFLKVDIGNGSITSGDPEQTTDLKSFKMSAKFKEKKQVENAVTLTIQISNENVEEGFYLKEIGIYVKGEGDEPILYWYCNEDNAQYINDKSESALAFEIDIKMQVSNATSNILNWSGEDTWVDVEYLNKQLAKKEDAFKKNTAFNKNFGVTTGTILEGNKYPIIEGIAGDEINPGFIQDATEKKENKFYLDKNTGRLYRCLKNTRSTINSAEFFRDVSLASINDKLDNLCRTNQLSFNDDKWHDIQYPPGFNKDNCIVMITDIGDDNKPTIYKINKLNSQFCAIGFKSNQYSYYLAKFTFIKF